MDADGISINFDLSRLNHTMPKEVEVALAQIGLHAVRESKRNAPRSPTMKQRSATLTRKRRTKQKSNSGGLERSITHDVMKDTVSVYVAQNAECRTSKGFNYAKRIHDEKGIKWFKRGAGTIAKGARADEKFIERAISDNEGAYRKKLEKAVEAAIRKAV